MVVQGDADADGGELCRGGRGQKDKSECERETVGYRLILLVSECTKWRGVRRLGDVGRTRTVPDPWGVVKKASSVSAKPPWMG